MLLSVAMNPDRFVLVIDDDHENRNAVRDLLEGAGYLVRTAPNGDVGLASLSALAGLPVVVVVDLIMPELDGFEFIRRARALVPDSRALPILVFSGDARAAAKALRLDVNDVLRKPLRHGEMIEAVARQFADLPVQAARHV